ncbi:MAG: glycoside hydrolase family 2 [Mediterranea massiliensis]|nr:glycoside hydrolase family 2 [Mediterranea massiliensis]
MKKIVWILLVLLLGSGRLMAQTTESIYLSGKGTDDAVMWDFYCTDGRQSGEWKQLPVPSNWEFHGFGQFTYGHYADPGERLNESGLYKYRFTVPAEWKNRKVNIVFDGSMTDTEVKINGRQAGPIHQGAFYRFRYDISRLLKYGKENLLEVTVHKASSNKTVEQAERNADFWVFGGIFRPVWLEALPNKHVERIAIDAKANGKFNMDVFLGKRLAKGEVVAQVKTLDGKDFGQPMHLSIAKQDSVRLMTTFENPALWSSEFPNRYQVEVSLWEDGKLQHRLTEKFGFRTAELRPGDGFYVNGEKIRFKGVNRHCHWPTSGRATNATISLNDALLIKEMNMNAIRMSHYPPDKHFLEVCDSLGLYVIDELTAWQYPPYDTEVGRKLVREMITRDVNHPCVVMWGNGNEGGFNFELLPDYARYDIQKRQVIHPWLEEKDVNTFHYISYGVATNYFFDDKKVFFPTEFLHGLYDGGHGAGLDDFWKLMLDRPLSAGGFLWDLADQGVVRNDRNDEMDTDGNHGADGILGPYREKEGSFYTIKEIWSPIYLDGMDFLPLTFDGRIKVENRYHFADLSQCHFTAEWQKWDYELGTSIQKTSQVTVPSVSPGLTGYLQVALPEDWKEYDVLKLKATDWEGKEIYTWTRTITPAARYATRLVSAEGEMPQCVETDKELTYNQGNTTLVIDKRKGVINRIEVDGKVLPLTGGPRFTVGELEVSKMDFDSNDGKVTFWFKKKDAKRQARNRITISLLPSQWVKIDYSFDTGGRYPHVGVTFDFPEEQVKGVKWLGNGPYRVWKNRLKGVTFGLWKKEYNNTLTGESWEYPEFKGFHSKLYAADLYTNGGTLKMVAEEEDLFLHLFTPGKQGKRNNDNTLGVFPDGQLSVLNAISAVGTKFKDARELGPQSQLNQVVSSDHADPITGKFYLKFEPVE